MATNIATSVCLLVALTFAAVGCGSQSDSNGTSVIKAVDVAVPVPGSTDKIIVPTYTAVDKSIGIKSLPKPIATGSPETKKLGNAVAKIFSTTGFGTGFFISKDGLFLTNQHVMPVTSCVARKCPGYKIVAGFHKDGNAKAYSDFEVLAHEGGEFDFALIKVNLKPGETVDFLELDLAEPTFETTWNGTRHTVLGHPGGAGLQFSEAKPYELSGASVLFRGVVIPGNSGGPIVDLNTKKVVGLVKSMRTAPVRDGAGSAYFENFNLATSIAAIDQLVTQKTGVGLTAITLETDMKELSKTEAKLPIPDEDDFGSALRRPSGDVRTTAAVRLFTRLIGSEHEGPALSLMLKKSSKFNGSINPSTLDRLLELSLDAGRPLRFEANDAAAIEGELELSGTESKRVRLRILINYFDENKRPALQAACLEETPLDFEAFLNIPHNCLTTKLPDGMSLFPLYARWLVDRSEYKSMPELMSVVALLMTTATVPSDDPEELAAIAEINEYVNKQGSDLMTLMNNDGTAIGILKKQLGVGSLKDTFPQTQL